MLLVHDTVCQFFGLVWQQWFHVGALQPAINAQLQRPGFGLQERLSCQDVFHFENGLAGYVEHLNRAKTGVSPIVRIVGEDDETGISCDIAMQYTDATSELMLAFGNNIINPDGGTHVQGFKTSLTRTINNYARRNNLLKELTPSGDDLREGLTAVISVRLPEPQFNNQTKEKLLNPEAEGFVSGAVSTQLGAWIEENPADGAAADLAGPLELVAHTAR